jgi:glutathione S-transferase
VHAQAYRTFAGTRGAYAESSAGSVSANDPTLVAFVEHFAARFGAHLVAVLAYGSYLRGKRDTVLDFYVLLDSYAALPPRLQGLANRALPPNVYHVTLGSGEARQAAKFATVHARAFRAVDRARLPLLFLGALRATFHGAVRA